MAKIAVSIIFLVLAVIFGIITIQGFERSEKLGQEIGEVTLEAEDAAITLIDACTQAKTDQDFQTCTIGMTDVLELCGSNSRTFEKVCGGENGDKIKAFLEMPKKQNELSEPKSAIEIAELNFNEKSLTALDVCMTVVSKQDLDKCKTTINIIKEQCKDPRSSHLSVCSDSRIDKILLRTNQEINQESSSASEKSIAKLPVDADLQFILARTVRDCIENTTVFLYEATDVLEEKSSYDNYEESIQIQVETISICSSEIKKIETSYCHWFEPSCTETGKFKSYWELIPKLQSLSDEMCEKLGYMCMYNFDEN